MTQDGSLMRAGCGGGGDGTAEGGEVPGGSRGKGMLGKSAPAKSHSTCKCARRRRGRRRLSPSSKKRNTRVSGPGAVIYTHKLPGGEDQETADGLIGGRRGWGPLSSGTDGNDLGDFWEYRRKENDNPRIQKAKRRRGTRRFCISMRICPGNGLGGKLEGRGETRLLPDKKGANLKGK